jgi:hypothetical protein
MAAGLAGELPEGAVKSYTALCFAVQLARYWEFIVRYLSATGR